MHYPLCLFSFSERWVGFTARIYSGEISIIQNTRLIFNQVKYRYGTSYNNATGIFTAPYSGRYLFIYNLESGSSRNLHVVLCVSGRGCFAQAKILPGNHTGGNSRVEYLRKGRRVWVRTIGFGGPYELVGWRSVFSGMLISPV